MSIWCSQTLYETHSIEELASLKNHVEDYPGSISATGLHMYKKSARQKLRAIEQAIAWHLKDQKEASR